MDYTLKKRLEKTKSHLDSTFRSYYIYEVRCYRFLNSIINKSKDYSKIDYEIDVNLYQLLIIKISILIDEKEKHSILKLFNIFNNPSLMEYYNLFSTKYKNTFEDIKHLRNKHFAHLDIPNPTDQRGLDSRELEEILIHAQSLVSIIWHQEVNTPLIPFDKQEYISKINDNN